MCAVQTHNALCASKQYACNILTTIFQRYLALTAAPDFSSPLISRLCIILQKPQTLQILLDKSPESSLDYPLSFSINLHHCTAFDPIGIILIQHVQTSYSTILDNQTNRFQFQQFSELSAHILICYTHHLLYIWYINYHILTNIHVQHIFSQCLCTPYCRITVSHSSLCTPCDCHDDKRSCHTGIICCVTRGNHVTY